MGFTSILGVTEEESGNDPTKFTLRKLEPGETCYVERRYRETNRFDFTGKATASDITKNKKIQKLLNEAYEDRRQNAFNNGRAEEQSGMAGRVLEDSERNGDVRQDDMGENGEDQTISDGTPERDGMGSRDESGIDGAKGNVSGIQGYNSITLSLGFCPLLVDEGGKPRILLRAGMQVGGENHLNLLGS